MEQLSYFLGLRKPAPNPFTVTSRPPIQLPEAFLTTAPPEPIIIKRINWSDTTLPELNNRYAVILDSVLTPEECGQLLSLAEQAVGDGADPWRPAEVNIGPGQDVPANEIRNCDRFIWKHEEMVERIWKRIALAPGVAEDLATADWAVSSDFPQYYWKLKGLNDKMRFLRYKPGQYFKPHNDGSHTEFPQGRMVKTHFTMHIYLGDSRQTAPEADLDGGATSFLSKDEQRKVDVYPKAGRVLIFQHRGMYHAGADVKEGIKYSLRTDLQYELTDKATQTPVDPMAIGQGFKALEVVDSMPQHDMGLWYSTLEIPKVLDRR